MPAPHIRRTLAAALALALLPALPAAAQVALTMEGRCERLVIDGEDLTAQCKGALKNTVARNRTSFDFETADGRSLSFSGVGAQQERTEETDPLQPISLVIPGKKAQDGVGHAPLPAVGFCKFSMPQQGKTTIACEASAQERRFEGTFVTDAKTASGAPAP